jgi:hypothetical protein
MVAQTPGVALDHVSVKGCIVQARRLFKAHLVALDTVHYNM